MPLGLQHNTGIVDSVASRLVTFKSVNHYIMFFVGSFDSAAGHLSNLFKK